jgi:hypothetical protein
LLPVKTNKFRLDGKSNIYGSIDYNINTGNLEELTIYHNTKGKLSFNNRRVQINDLSGKTLFFDNFSSHNSTISKADIEFDQISAVFSARVKGIKSNRYCSGRFIQSSTQVLIWPISRINKLSGSIKLLGQS